MADFGGLEIMHKCTMCLCVQLKQSQGVRERIIIGNDNFIVYKKQIKRCPCRTRNNRTERSIRGADFTLCRL